MREQLKSMTPEQIIQLLFTIGKAGKGVWDALKDSSQPRLKWRRDVINMLDEKDTEILALKLVVKELVKDNENNKEQIAELREKLEAS